MNERTYYETTLAQDVVLLQFKYTVHKRVINIMISATSNSPLDFDLMDKALDLTFKRNDCTSIVFLKKGGKLVQYFDHDKETPKALRYSFNTEGEQMAFIAKEASSPIKYLKGEVAKPYFINTFDHKSMVLFKVCHLIMDIYGLNIFLSDLFKVYNALLKGEDLPQAPLKYEDLVKKDLEYKHNGLKIEKAREYFDHQLKTNIEPTYAGIEGRKLENEKYRMDKDHEIKMFMFKNDTLGSLKEIDKSLADKIMIYCKDNHISPAVYYFYAMSLTTSILNGKVKNQLPIEIENVRATNLERNVAGTKAQSLSPMVAIDFNESFMEALNKFQSEQNELYRYLGFPDTDYQVMLHKAYKSSFLGTYYSFTFSFVPLVLPEGMEIMVYSNGKFPLPNYIALMYDLNKGNIKVAYDYETMLISEEDIVRFHEDYLGLLEDTVNNPSLIQNDILLRR